MRISDLIKPREDVLNHKFQGALQSNKVDFKEMRYPGYGWRYKDKGRKKGKNNLVDHYHKT